MRNVFDQYTQPENRLTHAFLTALDADRRLLDRFLTEVLNLKPPVAVNALQVLGQRYPGEDEFAEDTEERRGVPDGWISDQGSWCVLLESKVLTKLDPDQIRRHRRTAQRKGFQNITVVALTARKQLELTSATIALEWRAVYVWLLRNSAASDWAARATRYFEVLEATLIDRPQFVDGALTMFSGFPFGGDYPFTYLESRRLLGLALAELRQRHDLRKKLGMNPLGEGRGALRGKQENRVWDFLHLAGAPLQENFRFYPHLTLGITPEAVEATLTIPNAVNRTMRTNILKLRSEGFLNVLGKILETLEPILTENPGASPRFRGLQRRYLLRNSKPYIDALIDFDLRAAVGGGQAKQQARWLEAGYGTFVNKEGANYQIQVGVVFPYDRCPRLRDVRALDLIAGAWLGCKPLVDLGR